MVQTQKIPDEDYNKNYRSLLAEFHAIEIDSKGAKEKWEALKEKAKGVNPLSARQLAGIIERCNNAINGEYGNTKTAEHFGHGKPEKPEKK